MAQRQFSDVIFEGDQERFLSTADNNIHDVRNMDSYDGNRDSDIMKRSRFRNHHYLHGIHEDHTLPTERLVSFTMFDDDTPLETDNGFSMDTHVTYSISAALLTEAAGLVDGGAKCGLANPQEMRLMDYVSPSRYINITGVGDLTIPSLKIGNFASKVQLQDGRHVIMIFREYGELLRGNTGKTIHSKIRLAYSISAYIDSHHLKNHYIMLCLQRNDIHSSRTMDFW
eukprot:scaffold1914_cov110-Skeletonema_menzelii.AAC.1